MLPLENIKILDLSRLAAGNMVSHMFADFGADVVKVEKPGKGDDLRNWKINGISHWWAVYSRNKRSIAIDLKKDEGLDLLKELVKSADVFIENFVPGTLEKWGIGPEQLDELNKNLIILRISGWGQTGIFKNAPGFGSLVEGMSGFAAMTGEEKQSPLLPPLALADMVAGLTGDQLQAIESTRGLFNQAMALDPRSALASLARQETPTLQAASLLDTDIARYQNPYTEQVLEPALADIQRRQDMAQQQQS